MANDSAMKKRRIDFCLPISLYPLLKINAVLCSIKPF